MEKLVYEERLKRPNLNTLNTRRIKGDLIKVFKTIKGIDDLPLDYLLQICSKDKNRLRTETAHVNESESKNGRQAL